MVLLSHLSLIFFPYLHGQRPELIKSSFDKTLFTYPLGIFYSGTAAVYIFFCLSGFILTYACVNKGETLRNAAKMFSARYIRLAYPTFVSIMLCSLVLIIFHGHAAGLPWISQWGSTTDLGLFHVIYNALFSSILLGDATYNWVVWTMQVELFGSFLIFFSAPVIHTLKSRVIIYIVLAFLFGINAPNKIGFGYSAFLLGASLYYMPDIKNKIVVSILLLIGIYLGGYHYKQHAYTMLGHLETGILRANKIDGYYLYTLLSGYLLVMTCVKSRILHIVTTNNFSVWLGKVSFSAYLLQMPVFFLISPVFMYVNSISGINYTSAAFIAALLCLISLYTASWFFQRYIDAKSVALSKKAIPLLNYSREN
ncbi:acyltransferase family protein [Dryocola sp. BD586]|uniref:acyltransferase family protein n=1 Tax=Dryocola sp. BD586 TaxID=3133271 RepID=UPI003F4F6AEB